MADHAAFVLVDIFDGVRQRDDVRVPVMVHMVYHRRQGRGLAGARGAGEQDESVRQSHQLLHQGRKPELLHGGWDDGIGAENAAQMIPLVEKIDAEPVGEIGKCYGTIHLAVFKKVFFLVFAEEHFGAEGHHVARDGFCLRERRQNAVDPEDRQASHLKMDIRGVAA